MYPIRLKWAFPRYEVCDLYFIFNTQLTATGIKYYCFKNKQKNKGLTIDISTLNEILSKTKFAITERMDYADIMMGEKPMWTYKKWINFIENNADNLYIQSEINKYSKKIYLIIRNEKFELYVLDLLEKNDYYNLIKLCLSPVKIKLSNISDYMYEQIDSYFGISCNIEALRYSYDHNDHNDLLDERLTNKDNIHIDATKEKPNIDGLYIMEERSDYLFFKIRGFVFEAKKIAGQFDLYFERSTRDKILVAIVKNKNDILKSAEEFIDSW